MRPIILAVEYPGSSGIAVTTPPARFTIFSAREFSEVEPPAEAAPPLTRTFRLQASGKIGQRSRIKLEKQNPRPRAPRRISARSAAGVVGSTLPVRFCFDEWYRRVSGTNARVTFDDDYQNVTKRSRLFEQSNVTRMK